MIARIKRYSRTITLGTLAAMLSLSSCQDYLDVEPQDKLAGEQVYQDVYDADAVITGIYGKLTSLAKKYVVLNELRADLMSTTRNSAPELYELEIHQVNPDNPYANPRDFYELINDCNDALKNFDLMLQENRLNDGEYDQRYSDIGSIRSWLYLQVGIHYGTVPYITEPIENIDDVRNIDQFPRIPFEQLLQELVTFTEALPFTSLYDATSSLIIDVDGYNTAKFFINKECLLGDLRLWKGDYQQAASHYKTVMETASNGAGSYLYNHFRVPLSFPDDEGLTVEYLRFREQDSRSLINSNTDGWGSMFVRDPDALWNTEWIWSIPFDSNFAPENPFIDMFSIQNGDYQLKPSQHAVNLWDSQTQLNGFPYDARGRKFSYFKEGEDLVVKKYLYGYLDPDTQMPIDIFERDGRWFLYRAGKLHLRFAEAANRDGYHRLADALLNFGIQSAYTVEGAIDKTNIERTNLPFPYDFDARNGEFPFYRGNWYRNTGLRGRAYIERAEVLNDSLIDIENNIIREDGLELAFEGNRWGDLVRIAIRRNDPSFLADKVYNKLLAENNPQASAVRTRLLNRQNWYLPFSWKGKSEEESDQ